MKFSCSLCNYSTIYSTHYQKHIDTQKHQKRITVSETMDVNPPGCQNLKSGGSDNLADYIIADTSEESENEKLLCEHCGLKLYSQSSLNRHLNTCSLKNIKPEQKDDVKNLKCPMCNLQCNRKSSLTRHIKICTNKPVKPSKPDKPEKNLTKEELKIKLIKAEYEKKLADYERKLIEEKLKAKDDRLKDKDKIIDVYAEQTKNSNDLAIGNMCNVNGLIHTNMRAMTYLKKYSPNTPALKSFMEEHDDPYIFFIDYEEHERAKENDKSDLNSKNNILYFDEDKMTKDDFLVDHILFLQKSNKLETYIAERLIHFYKKEGDNAQQSIWNIDIYRHNFAISVKSGNTTIWHSDKGGQMTADIVIKPILEFVCEILKKNLLVIGTRMGELSQKGRTNEVVNLVKDMGLINDFIFSVKNNTLPQQIIRKISTAFTIEKAKDSLLIN
jgi:hypothetical protein